MQINKYYTIICDYLPNNPGQLQKKSVLGFRFRWRVLKNLILRCIDGGYCKGINLAGRRGGGNMGGKIMVTRSSMPKFEDYIEEIKDYGISLAD